MTNRSREENTIYMRERRARMKAEAAAAGLVTVRPLAKDHPIVKAGQRSDAENASPAPVRPAPAPVRLAPAPVRLAPVSLPAPPPAPLPEARLVGRASSETPFAPQSMFAVGGRPGRGLIPLGPGYAAPPDIAAAAPFMQWRDKTEAMLAALAAKSDAQERRIAALENAAMIEREMATRAARVLSALAEI